MLVGEVGGALTVQAANTSRTIAEERTKPDRVTRLMGNAG